jgi:hypothetical protein
LITEDANHVLKHEPRPRSELAPTEVARGYNAPGAQLDAEVQDNIVAWLAAHT